MTFLPSPPGRHHWPGAEWCQRQGDGLWSRDKILVFHFKRKKQYKKIYGHRQPFTAVRITEIAFDGQRFAAPDLPARKPKKVAPVEAEEGGSDAPKAKAPPQQKGKAASPGQKGGGQENRRRQRQEKEVVVGHGFER